MGVVIGVSGGPDSVALLHLLNMLSLDMGFRIAVAHLDHGLRPESPSDAEFVRAMARKLGAPVRLKKVEVAALASAHGVSVEEEGRRVRYAFFEKVRDSAGCDVIATAHHMEDQIETFFLRLFRGSTLRGLGGIPAKRDRVIRPLIRTRRSHILRFLEEEQIPYRVDTSNLDAATDRNFVRNRIVPVMAERFPDFREPLTRTIGMIHDEDRFLDELATDLYKQAIIKAGDDLTMDVDLLRRAPDVLLSRALLKALYDLSGPDVRWTSAHVNAVISLVLNQSPSATVQLPGGIVLRREYCRIISGSIQKAAKEGASGKAGYEITVSAPGRVLVPQSDSVLTFRLLDRNPGATCELPAIPDTAFFDAEKAGFPLTIRSPVPGDRFKPWGIEGTRKLKKILIDLKIPVRLRAGLPLLVKDGEILWVPGIRRGRGAAVDSSTKTILEVTLRLHSDDRRFRCGTK